MVKIKRAIEEERGQRRLERGGFVGAKFPEEGIVVEGVYIPWSVLDDFRQSDEMELEFEPWSRHKEK